MGFWVHCLLVTLPSYPFLLIRHSLRPFVPASLPLSASRPPLLFHPTYAFHPLRPLQLAAAKLEAAQKLSWPAFSPPSIVAALFSPLHLPPPSQLSSTLPSGHGVARIDGSPARPLATPPPRRPSPPCRPSNHQHHSARRQRQRRRSRPDSLGRCPALQLPAPPPYTALAYPARVYLGSSILRFLKRIIIFIRKHRQAFYPLKV
jgi:hypothetical protein